MVIRRARRAFLVLVYLTLALAWLAVGRLYFVAVPAGRDPLPAAVDADWESVDAEEGARRAAEAGAWGEDP